METYIVPLIFPDLDTAKRDLGPLLDAMRTAGLTAEAADPSEVRDRGGDADRVDPGPTAREIHVHADGAEEARRRVQQVVDGQFPPGMVLLGEPTPAPGDVG